MRILSIIMAVLFLASGALLVATPAAAAEPLNWEMKVDAPSGIFHVLAPGSDILDYASDNTGTTMYAITRVYTVTCSVTTGITETDDVTETLAITYTNENGVTARTGSSAVLDSAAVDDACAVTLQAGDYGISDVTGIAVTTSDATAGVITLWGGAAGTTSLGTFTFGGAFADGAANPGTDRLLKTTLGGALWSNITTRLTVGGVPILDNLDYVAMAPDDPNVIVVADATPVAGIGAAISTDGGDFFTSLDLGSVTTVNTALSGLEISPMVAGNIRYIAVFGSDTDNNNDAVLYYYDWGAGVGAWGVVTDFELHPVIPGYTATIDKTVALAFSPNFDSDYTAVVLCEQDGASIFDNGALLLYILDFDMLAWGVDFPVFIDLETIEAADNTFAAFAVNSASLALLPDYDFGDEFTRMAFIGAAITTDGITTDGPTEVGGVWRCYDVDTIEKTLGSEAGVGINSVAFDGTNLAAGAYDTNEVYRTTDVLWGEPLTFFPARSLKRIGLDTIGVPDKVQLAFIGGTLYGAKRGTASALSRSTDYGHTWNDFTLMDSATTVIDDIYMISDMEWYVSAHDGVTSSVYRISDFSVTRVLCVPAISLHNPDFMLRGVPSEPGVIYAADEGGTVLYYSADGGLGQWYLRDSVPVGMADLAVESAQDIYIADAASVNVYKSTDSGSNWGLPMNTKLTGFNAVINMIISVGENNVVVAGNGGGVVYSTNGGDNWTQTMGVFNAFCPLQIAASGLGLGDYIFVSEEATNTVWRCEISTANWIGEFKTMNFPAAVGGEVNTGLVYYNGILYVLQTDAAGNPGAGVAPGTSYITRSLTPTVAGAHAAFMWGTRYAETGAPFLGAPTTLTFNTSPTALKVSDGPPGSVMLYAIDTATLIFGSPAPGVKYFEDTLALAGPELVSPADGTQFPAGRLVSLLWNRPSQATAYYVQVALDADFYAPLPMFQIIGTFDVMSLILGNDIVPPNNTFYWRVRSYLPLGSPWSEVRSFTIEPVTDELGPTVRVNAPAWAANSYNITIPVDISGVQNFNAASYNITFNTAVLTLNDVTGGDIGGTSIPVDVWNEYNPGEVSIVNHLAGISGVSGSGHLAVLHFTAIGFPADSTELDIHDGVLSGNIAGEITATWIDDLVYIADFIMGDANGDGEVNALDVTAVERIIVGLPPWP